MNDIYRLVYTSRNLLGGREDEQASVVADILRVSKRNNTRVGVTGALLFNAGSFAQVLEGSRGAVEATFERIQRDPRHSDVSVLQCEPVTARGFPHWSMAFVGQSARGRALWDEIARKTDFDFGRLGGDELFATLLAIVREEEGPAADAPVTVTEHADAKAQSGTLDVERLRAALGQRTPAQVSAMAAPLRPTAPAEAVPEAGTAILQGALEEERERTTELRRRLDEARMALAVADGEMNSLRRHRDIWSDRSTALRSSLREVRVALAASAGEAESLRARLAGIEGEMVALRHHRDIWAGRARGMAAAMCREPDFDGREGGSTASDSPAAERGARPSLVRTVS